MYAPRFWQSLCAIFVPVAEIGLWLRCVSATRPPSAKPSGWHLLNLSSSRPDPKRQMAVASRIARQTVFPSLFPQWQKDDRSIFS